MIEKAKAHLEEGGFALVILAGDQVLFTSKARGIAPLMEVYKDGSDVNGAVLADRVIGQAAARIALDLGIKAVYAKMISEPALQVLEQAGVPVVYDRLVPMIENRNRDGRCPVETISVAEEDFQQMMRKIDSFLLSVMGG